MKPDPTPSAIREAGFSLLEILVAMGILIFGLTVTALFSRNITQISIIAEQNHEAMHLARSRLEQLRHFRDRIAYDNILNGSSSITGANTTYTLTWTVTTQATPPLKTVRMHAEWSDPSGTTQSVDLASMIAWSDPMNSGRILQ